MEKNGTHLTQVENIEMYSGSAKVSFLPKHRDAWTESTNIMVTVYVRNHISTASASESVAIVGELWSKLLRVVCGYRKYCLI